MIRKINREALYCDTAICLTSDKSRGIMVQALSYANLHERGDFVMDKQTLKQLRRVIDF